MWDRSAVKVKLCFIRHGATKSNELRKYLGRTDEALSENGIAGLLDLKHTGIYPAAELVAASPMKRCLQTAEIIYNVPPLLVIDTWREIDFGRFEGKDYQELAGDPEYQKWIDSQGMLPFPEGESRDDFIRRCVDGFRQFCEDLLRQEFHPESAALIVHGGTIMSILSTYSEIDYYSFQCQNGRGYRCELYLSDQIQIREIKLLN